MPKLTIAKGKSVAGKLSQSTWHAEKVLADPEFKARRAEAARLRRAAEKKKREEQASGGAVAAAAIAPVPAVADVYESVPASGHDGLAGDSQCGINAACLWLELALKPRTPYPRRLHLLQLRWAALLNFRMAYGVALLRSRLHEG